MPALEGVVTKAMQSLELQKLKRSLVATEREQGGIHVKRGGKQLISFCCNDYLGLTQHPSVLAAADDALLQYGAGAGASRYITGNNPLYDDLEQKIAAWKEAEAALVFGSGYLASLGTIPALLTRDDMVVADRLVHACIIDAVKLSSAKLYRFAHNNPQDAARIFEKNRSNHRNALVITEGVFSMDGDRAPLPDLSKVSKRWDAWFMVDDAHGLGTLGRGRGSSHEYKTRPHIDIQMGTFSKACGSYGGYVCGMAPLIEQLRTTARSAIYSTGLPPATLAASLKALEIMENDPARVSAPIKKARLFSELLALPRAESPIVPFIVGSAEKALDYAKKLEEAGYLVAAIRPPTVPKGTARLRFTFSATHQDEDIEKLAGWIRAQGWK